MHIYLALLASYFCLRIYFYLLKAVTYVVSTYLRRDILDELSHIFFINKRKRSPDFSIPNNNKYTIVLQPTANQYYKYFFSKQITVYLFGIFNLLINIKFSLLGMWL